MIVVYLKAYVIIDCYQKHDVTCHWNSSLLKAITNLETNVRETS
jgi:hypothetical protein